MNGHTESCTLGAIVQAAGALGCIEAPDFNVSSRLQKKRGSNWLSAETHSLDAAHPGGT